MTEGVATPQQVPLAARKRFVVGLMTMTPVAKTNTVTATADTPQNIQESNEKNNTDTQTLTVVPEEREPTEPSVVQAQ